MHEPALTAVLRKSLRLAAACACLALLAGVTTARAQVPSDSDARIDIAVRAIADDPRMKDTPPAVLREITDFATGNMLFVLLHEMGHALISDLGLPVLGKEEDAVDQFATVAMIKLGNDFTHRTLVNATKGWLFSHRRDAESGEKMAFYDAHGLDLQRAYSVVCLMVGSDPAAFKDLADETNLPEDRRETCVGDYSNASWSWDKILKPYLRAPDQPRQTVNIVYDEAKDPFDLVRNAIRATGILEHTAAYIVDRYAFTRPFTLQMSMCGEPNANWELPTRTLTLCYEMARDFAALYRTYGKESITVIVEGQPSDPAGPANPTAKGFR